jgi:hypothetical protein
MKNNLAIPQKIKHSIPVIPALEKLRQEDCKFKVSWGNSKTLSPKK